MMRLLLTIIVALMTTTAVAEDWQGYVLRRSWWGVSYYWVHDSDRWGEPHALR